MEETPRATSVSDGMNQGASNIGPVSILDNFAHPSITLLAAGASGACGA